MSGNEMLALNDRRDSAEVASVMRSVMCEDSSVLMALFADLQNSLSAAEAMFVGGVNGVCFCVPRVCANCSSFVNDYCDLSPKNRSTLPSSPSQPGFLISCLHPASDAVGRLRILSLEFADRSPPPSFLSIEVTSVTSTSIMVNVTMNGLGYLSCGSYPVTFIFSGIE
jgi:hypothetical protein